MSETTTQLVKRLLDHRYDGERTVHVEHTSANGQRAWGAGIGASTFYAASLNAALRDAIEWCEDGRPD